MAGVGGGRGHAAVKDTKIMSGRLMRALGRGEV